MARGRDGEHHGKGRRSVSGRRGWIATLAVVLLIGVAALVWWQRGQGRSDGGPARCAPTSVVLAVSDGDTVRFDCDGSPKGGRLDGIDAPERSQPHGPEARAALQAMIAEGPVTVETVGSDRYGRAIVTLTPAAGGPTLNARLVAGGHAWHYTRYSDDVELAEAERTARAARAGLWQAETPQPPWDYRKAKRTREAEGASD